MKLLLNDQRVDINKADKGGWSPFCIACQEHTEVVKVLLNDQRVDINKSTNYGNTPFYIACAQIEIVKLLLVNQRIDINKANNDGITPFFIACERGQIETVNLLLGNERIDVNKADKNGRTPFCAASLKGQIEVLKYLLASERSVNLNEKDNEGKTSIDLVREQENKEKQWRESEEIFQKRKQRFRKVIELLEAFERNPNEMKTKLRIELGFAGKIIYFSF